MKKSNKLDLSKYKKITNKKVIDVKGDYFIVENDEGKKGIIDCFDKQLLKDDYLDLIFITKDIVLLESSILFDLKNKNIYSVNSFCKKCFVSGCLSYNIYDYNFNKIYDVDIKYPKFNYLSYKIKDKDNNVSTIKGNKIRIIDMDRYLIYKGKKELIVDGKNNILCEVKGEELEIIQRYGIVFRKDAKDDSYIGFINQDNEIVDISFINYKIVDDNTIIIGNHNGKYYKYRINGKYYKYRIIDNKGNTKLDKDFNSIKYDNDTNLYVYNCDKLYGVMDNEFNEVISNNYKTIEIIGENVFKIPDGNFRCKLINREEKVIYTYDDLPNLTIKNIGDLVTITDGNKTTLIDTSGNTIIPFVENSIIIMDNNRILVDNCIIDLNVEYLDLKINYELELECLGYRISKSFSDDLNRDKFIKCINELKDRYSNELNNLLHGNEVLHTGEKQYIKKKNNKK